MLIASLAIGDTLVTLTCVIPLDREELQHGIRSYNLTFTDIPTDKSYTKSFSEENLAMQCLAAWIAADDPVENIRVATEALYSDPDMKPFLP